AATPECLGDPRPREAVRIGEVEGTADSTPDARAREEADFPVVDVQQEWTAAPRAREQSHSEARRPRFGRDENLAVDEREERRHVSRETRGGRGLHAAIRDAPVPRRDPDPFAELRPDHGHVVARREETSKEVRATRRV